MDPTLLTDAARALHLVGLALGFGVAMIADASAARMLFRPLDAREIESLHRFHRTVATGLALFWISGLVLLWLKTGFQAEHLSHKLMTKLGVVALLTVNAALIGRIALPVVRAMRGQCFGALPLGVRSQLAVLGALSTAGWISAMALGVFSQLKTLEWSHLSQIVGTIYLAALSGAAIAAVMAPFLARLHDRRPPLGEAALQG